MKRLHVHVSVENLNESIAFYSALFDAAPSVNKEDYAKWMLDDPRVNFAISQRGKAKGLDHLGIQAESANELLELNARLEKSRLPNLAQQGSTCCYAKSDKHWSVDPSGLPWEMFHTLDSIPTYGVDSHSKSTSTSTQDAQVSSCGCVQTPAQKAATDALAVSKGSSCCS